MAETIINLATVAAVAVPVLSGILFVNAATGDCPLDGLEDPDTDAPEFPALATEEDLQKGAAR